MMKGLKMKNYLKTSFTKPFCVMKSLKVVQTDLDTPLSKNMSLILEHSVYIADKLNTPFPISALAVQSNS